ncbi:Eco57I restriction-modification methylase domain-containing protein [Tunturiibacter gelidoferens]|uniref:site-specific DNA-methyltransferase (adenine-specific) n=1 Tax=Tunturiibacter gelidiferens TaxID=3069689 RepID=A0A9X0QFJ7_9BACT|nr:DNA methyltransferase [Edaphobacter lichenicola]MBB5329435.1 hypothetical protein [Edaphobacter lichenicola]
MLTALLGYPSALIVENQALPAGLEANMAEMGENLRPDFALVSPAGSEAAGQAQLLISSYPAEQALDRPVIGKHWKANPGTRMMELLHTSGVALGLVTNGEHWMLVFAPRGETTGYASWYGALWLDEPITLRAFHSLLGVRRFFGVASDDTLLGMLKESSQDQEEVTDQLGYQVREAVEVLVQAFDTLDQDANRTLLKGVSDTAIYESALTVMMRLVFLFSAEERGLLLLGKPLYDDNYAVSTLLEQLQEVADLHGPQVLERRCDAWARLLATFRAVHSGVHHQDLLIPAYGGSLFDPDRFPFLEGRSLGTNWVSTQAEPLAVNNRVALHLLTSLQRLRIKMPGGGPSETRRISFLALGVEQIGHVYEGLLDHVAERAHETVLGIEGTRKKEAEIPLTTLEAKLAQGQDELIELLKDETGRSGSAIKRALDLDNPVDEHKLVMACAHDEELLQRIRPFAGVIREDSFERPLVVLPGCVYVTAGTTRRSTGTHYTPPSLTQPIVQYTLEPLVYQGPAEGWPRDRWLLKLPKQILDLKVCDMAMGSGAFLVQTCRYLAERLTEAWENEEKKHPGEVLITPEGDFSRGAPSERLVPQDAAERLAIARRIVADRCLYGIDINPMAVEMAKLSLWLTTLDSKRPFTFLDHAFKCGDSLLGLSSLKQLEDFSLRPGGVKQVAFSTVNLWRHVEEAKRKRELLEALPSDTPEQIASKSALHAEAEESVVKLLAAGDVLVATELKGLRGKIYEKALEESADRMMIRWARGTNELVSFASSQLSCRKTFHWPLEFPEIIERGGFDAFIGNPPFRGGKLISGIYGKDFREYLVLILAGNAKGHADLCAYFLLRIVSLLKTQGLFGLLATNSIAEGDTREVALDRLHSMGITLVRAVKSSKWPGIANLEVAHLWGYRGQWNGKFILGGLPAIGITSFLAEDGGVVGLPYRLYQNKGRGFQGTVILGKGFVLSNDEATSLLEADSRSREVIYPYLNGEDLNSRFDQSPSRQVINFFDWPLDRVREYPVCLKIIEDRVRPERTLLAKKSDSSAKGYARLWWQFARRSTELYATVADHKTVLASCRHTKYVCHSPVPANQVFDVALNVFPIIDRSAVGALHSFIYETWVRKYGSSLETRVRYTVTDCFETYPFPKEFERINEIADELLRLRPSIMSKQELGLTALYNRFHDSEDTSLDIANLRKIHVLLDEAVIAAYGWSGLDLGHGFHETKHGTRFTISEIACRKVLDLLLALNHERHAEEEAATAAVLEASSMLKVKNTRKSTKGNTQVAPTLFS